MAILEEWIVPEAITDQLAEREKQILGAALPGNFECRVEYDDARIVVILVAQLEQLARLAELLDKPLGVFEGWDWEDEIEELEEGDSYLVEVELQQKVPETVARGESERPVLSVYSKDANNNEAWPIAFILAARLASELGAIEAEAWPKVLN